jgi:hypothetical protein
MLSTSPVPIINNIMMLILFITDWTNEVIVNNMQLHIAALIAIYQVLSCHGTIAITENYYYLTFADDS